METAIEMGSGVTIYIPSFIKTGSGIQTLWEDQKHRLQGDLLEYKNNKLN
jgi:hypothetical protein